MPRRERDSSPSPDVDPVTEGARILRRGGLVAFPTETVYGLGADADNAEAVARIFAAKGRPSGRPLTLHLGPTVSPHRWGQLDARAETLVAQFWPGPLTLVVPKHHAPDAPGQSRVPDIVTGGFDTVGLRVPSHPLAIALLDAFGGAVAAPSANRSGGLSPTTADHVRDDLGDRVDWVLDGGPCTVGIESTVLSLAAPDGVPVILRLGATPRHALEAILGPVRVQGQSEPHYRPATPVVLADPPSDGPCGVLSFRTRPAGFQGTWICAPADPVAYGGDLYRMLRTLDAAGHAQIVVEPVPEDVAWETVASRLAAAAGTG